jgi:hypothetical protein
MATLEFKIDSTVNPGYLVLSVKRGATTYTTTMAIPPIISHILHLSTGSYMYPRFEFVGVTTSSTPKILASISYASLLDTRGSANMNATLTVKNTSVFFSTVSYDYSYSNNHTNSVNYATPSTNVTHNFTYYVPSANTRLYGAHIIIGSVAIGFKNITVNAVSYLNTNNPNDMVISSTYLHSEVQNSVPSSLNLISDPFEPVATNKFMFKNDVKNISSSLNLYSYLDYNNTTTLEPAALIISNISIYGSTLLDGVIGALSSQSTTATSPNTIAGYLIQSVSPPPIVPDPAPSWS